MDDPMLLSAEEVADLSGYQQPTAQIRWLAENDLAYLLGGDGKPKVLRALVVRRLGGEPARDAPKRQPELRF